MCPIKDTEAGSGGFQNGGLLEDSHGTGDRGRATDDDPGVIAMSAKKREAEGLAFVFRSVCLLTLATLGRR